MYPSKTREYNDYVSNVIEVFGGKVIICIDELDKITNPEEVKKLLRSIKGAIFQKNSYYLISISEDAVRSFKTRISTERDMLESTFDEIINLDRINIDVARKIAKKRLGYKAKEELSRNVKMSIDVVCILSGGIPRELIRNLREVNMKFGKADIIPTKAWKLLFEKKIGDFKNEVMLTSISEDIKYDIADQLALFNGEIQLRETLDGLYKRLESKRLESSKSDEKKEMAQEIDKLQKGTLELKIDAIIFEYLKKNMSNGEEFLHNLLKAYFMLPYCKMLSEKYISDAITLLNAKLLFQEKSK